MKTIPTKRMVAYAVVATPVALLALPAATSYAQTVDTPTATLQAQEQKVIADQQQLDVARADLVVATQHAEMVRDQIRSQTVHEEDTSERGEVHEPIIREQLEGSSDEYTTRDQTQLRTAVDGVEDAMAIVDARDRALHYDANEYRAQLYNMGWPVPAQLPFITDAA